MKLEILPDAEAVAAQAATRVASEARAAVAERGRFAFAVSGGTTPWEMLRSLAEQAVPWDGVHVFQVDERVAPAGDPVRNLTHLRESLVARAPIPEAQVHPMPVEQADLGAAAVRYAQTLVEVAGDPPVLDLVYLGLGLDGHTASPVPGGAPARRAMQRFRQTSPSQPPVPAPPGPKALKIQPLGSSRSLEGPDPPRGI